MHFFAFHLTALVEPQSGAGSPIFSGSSNNWISVAVLLHKRIGGILLCSLPCWIPSGSWLVQVCVALLWIPMNDLGHIMVLTHFVMFWGMKRAEPGQGDVGATDSLHVCTLGPSAP